MKKVSFFFGYGFHGDLHSFPTRRSSDLSVCAPALPRRRTRRSSHRSRSPRARSEEHTSELQSLRHLVCRLLLEKKNCCNRVGHPPCNRASHAHALQATQRRPVNPVPYSK